MYASLLASLGVGSRDASPVLPPSRRRTVSASVAAVRHQQQQPLVRPREEVDESEGERNAPVEGRTHARARGDVHVDDANSDDDYDDDGDSSSSSSSSNNGNSAILPPTPPPPQELPPANDPFFLHFSSAAGKHSSTTTTTTTATVKREDLAAPPNDTSSLRASSLTLTGHGPAATSVNESTTSSHVDGDLFLLPSVRQSWSRYLDRKLQGAKHTKKTNKSLPRQPLTLLQQALASSILRDYADVAFHARSLGNAVELRELYALHIANHVLKARAVVDEHDRALQLRKKQARSTGRAPEPLTEEEEEAFRDQGYARPRVLVLLPFKNAAFRFVKTLLELFPDKTRVKNVARFLDEFSPVQADDDDDDNEQKEPEPWKVEQKQGKASGMWNELDLVSGTHPILNTERQAKRPADWYASFEGNTGEDFRMGIAVNSSKSVRLYTSFYQSDIIVASPLGLRLATKQAMEVAEEEEDEDEDEDEDDVLRAAAEGAAEDDRDMHDGNHDDQKKKQQRKRKKRRSGKGNDDDAEEGASTDTDFLSSIEVLVIDEADVFHMQNWQHLEDVCVAINRPPSEIRPHMDFSRIHERFLDGHAALHRQTLVFSSFPDGMLNALISRGGAGHKGLFRNRVSGAVRVRPSAFPGVTSLALAGVPQRFRFVEATATDDRFQFFCDRVLLTKLASEEAMNNPELRTLLFIPSYFDFVRVRNAFREAEYRLDPSLRPRRTREKKEREDEDDLATKGRKKRAGVSTQRKRAKNEHRLFVECCEYTTPSNIARARSLFFQGRARVLLCTERFHFYYRYAIRGANRVVFYAPPQHAHFYVEMVDCLKQTTSPPEVVTFYSDMDVLEMERIVGTRSANALLKGREREVTVMCTEE